MDWKIERKPGLEVYLSDVGNVVIRNTDTEESDFVCLSPESIPQLIEILNHVRETSEFNKTLDAVNANVPPSDDITW